MTAKLGVEGQGIVDWLFSVPTENLPGLMAHLEGQCVVDMPLRDAFWFHTAMLACRFVVGGAHRGGIAGFIATFDKFLEEDPDVTAMLGPWTSPLARYVDPGGTVQHGAGPAL